MSYIKNTAGQFLGFLLVNCCGAPVTGAEVAAVCSIDGASQTAATGTVTELGGGQYSLEMSQADTNGDDITFLFTATNAVPVEKTITTAEPVTPAASGSYFGVRPPKLQSGKVILPLHMRPNQIATVGTTASKYYFVPFYLSGGQSYAGVAFWNAGTGDSGKKVKIAFYNEATTGGPGTLAKNFGEFTLDNTSGVRQLVSSWTPAEGWYYGAFAADSVAAFGSMGSSFYISQAGYQFPNLAANPMGCFLATAFTSDPRNDITCDYVSGTYSNFPESTAVAPTDTYRVTQLYNSAGNGYVPAFGLYT